MRRKKDFKMDYPFKQKPISKDDPINHIWKYLRLFSDITTLTENLSELYSMKKTDKHYNNLIKQAKQINYCIKQAEEYYQASEKVTLATRPLLLYYGTVCLSQALYLLRKDGTYSLDALREKERHNHHGLELIKSSINSSIDFESFLKSIQCQIYVNNYK